MRTGASKPATGTAYWHHRLFWKILLGFWLTLLAVGEGVWIVATYYQGHAQIAQAQQRSRIESATAAISYGGIPALKALTAHWTAQQRGDLHVMLDEDSHQLNDPSAVPVVAPDGTRYRIDYRSLPPPPPPTWLHMPPELVIPGIPVSLIFSALLAVYLTRPLRHLRRGLARFAEGDLAVRVGPTMPRRHDEIAELAGDFDRMAERIESLLTTREQLLHDVSHELRSPLARLAVATDLLRHDPLRGHAAAIERIEREVHRLDRLVDEVLTLSRAESDAPSMDEYVDMAGLMQAVAQDVGFEASAHGVQVIAEIDNKARSGDDMTIKGSIELLQRMLENVVRNAVRFSPAGELVTMRLRVDTDGMLKLSVTDQGPGVPAEALQHIFDPFVHGDGVNSRSGGHGLGLAIARRAAMAHGGSIEATNLQPGGLCVVISLPGPRQ